MSGVYIEFKSPKTHGASAANTKYITREPATGADPSALYLHNLVHLQGEDYQETRNNIISFAEARLDEEQVRSQKNPRESRTHYRAILSFDRAEDSEKARDLAKDWLAKNFKDARAVVAVHQDKAHHTKNGHPHSHCHVWIDARDINDKKLQLNNRQFKNLDTSWAKIYAKEYGEHYLEQHLEKKQEMKKFKQDYRQAKEEGRITPAPPNRARQNNIQNRQDQERANYGFIKQSGPRDNKLTTSIRLTIDGRRKQDFERAVNADEQASREAREAIREAKRLHNRLGEVRGGGERANREFNDAVLDVAKTRNRFEEVGGRSSRVDKEKRDEQSNNERVTRER
jgi:hypothetical protein